MLDRKEESSDVEVIPMERARKLLKLVALKTQFEDSEDLLRDNFIYTINKHFNEVYGKNVTCVNSEWNKHVLTLKLIVKDKIDE